MKIRQIVLWVVALLVAVEAFILITDRESIYLEGEVIFLKLAPVDPRALLQGDYMTLRYAMGRSLRNVDLHESGALVVRLGGRKVARFVREHTPGEPLAAGELLLRYIKVGRNVQVGPDAFFFQEGQASEYSRAEYAELRVDEQGNMVLVGLRGENLEVLGED